MALHSRFLWQKMRVSLLMAAVGGTFTYFLMRTPVDAFSPAAKVLLSSRHNNYSPSTYYSSSVPSLTRTNDEISVLRRRPHVPKLAKNPQQQEDDDDDTVTAKKRFFGFAVLKRRVKRIFRRRRSKPALEESLSIPLDDISEDQKDSSDLEDAVVSTTTTQQSFSNRSATAADNVDLSGTWKPIVTAQFKQDYDEYLQNCSQSFMFRKVVVNGIGYQTEIVSQKHQGRDLEITATNPAGNWNRTLIASSEDDPVFVTLQDPDGDTVQVEAWWEDEGTKHKSWLRGKPRVQGGAFETTRYLDSDNENVLICESIFHPGPEAPSNFQPGSVIWRYERVA